MRYTPHTERDVKEMLGVIGAALPEIFEACGIPERAGSARSIDGITGGILSEEGLSALETERELKRIAAKNKVYGAVFLGAGAYNHYIPPVVRHITANPRFVTAYTPYQPELSQGILQAIFEYQSGIVRLTGLDVSNASMYDGAASAAEAVLMCVADKPGDILISEGVNPEVRAVVAAYLGGTGRSVTLAPLTEDGLTDAAFIAARGNAACCLIQQPNYYGNIEDAKAFGALLNGNGVRYIMHSYPTALGILASPGECGADFATGEGQPLGLPLSFGGPYLGYIAAREKYVRKMTGRIVGETTDREGRTVYVLTLQAREQHIRREKASSSICSNEALCALAAAVYLCALGKNGFRAVAADCFDKAHYLAEKLERAGLRLKYKNAEFFNEFVTVSDSKKSSRILKLLDEADILGGLKLNEREILWCATEMNDKKQIDGLAELVERV
ncbi:MAG: aminomethyl-transferring glycine dehydrogenase subunit GcvPA [Clostridiales bacterium]|jgi:glycine dehydrogenase subunit 1|nr:aminomethyl-transferring glycine dehydrogenase subunit GcvPA [Clostridiales bacterium]